MRRTGRIREKQPAEPSSGFSAVQQQASFAVWYLVGDAAPATIEGGEILVLGYVERCCPGCTDLTT